MQAMKIPFFPSQCEFQSRQRIWLQFIYIFRFHWITCQATLRSRMCELDAAVPIQNHLQEITNQNAIELQTQTDREHV